MRLVNKAQETPHALLQFESLENKVHKQILHIVEVSQIILHQSDLFEQATT